MYRKKSTRINYRLLIATGIVFVALCLLVLLIQFRQNRASVLKLELQTDAQIADRDYAAAFKSLKRLLVLKPDDNQRKLQLALCADQLAEDSRRIQESIRLNIAALSLCQANSELESNIPVIRRRLVKRFLDFGSYENAIDQITRMVSANVDLELQRCYAIAKVQLWLDGRGADVATSSSNALPNWFASLSQLPPVDLLVKTHVEAPEDFEIAGMLVDLCLGDPAKLNGSFLAGDSKDSLKSRAQAIVERLVSSRPKDPFSWLLRYEISSRDNKFGLSEDDLERAVELGPDNPKVLLVAGKLFLERAKRVTGVYNRQIREAYLNRSLDLFENSRSIQPNDTQTYLNIGEVHGMLGNPEKAIDTWRDGKRVCEERVSQLDFNIANTLTSLNKLDEARDALAAMDQSVKSELPSLNRYEQSAFTRLSKEAWARFHLASGDFQTATKLLQDVLSLGNQMDAVNQAAVYSALGDCYRQIGQFDRAASSFEQAILLTPNTKDYRRRAANAWFATGRFAESYKQYMLVEPKEATDWVQICDVVLEMQRLSGQDASYWFTFDKGISEIKRLIALNSNSLRSVWILELLQIDANILRAPEATRSSLIQSSADQLWQIVEQENWDPPVLRAAITRWKAWGQSEYLAKANQALEQLSEDRASAIEKAELLAGSGNESQAKTLLENKLKEKPNDPSVQDAIMRMELANLPFDQAIESIRGMKQGGWFIARRLAWNTLKRPLVLSEAEQRDPELRAKRFQTRIDQLKTLEEVLKDYEGAEGTEWRYLKGRRLLAEAIDPQTLNSIELLDLASFLDRKRPEWPESHILAGLVAESQSNKSRAIREYNYAIQYGNSDLETYERLVNLLYQQGLVSDARVAIDRLGNKAYASRPLAAISLQLASEKQQDQLAAAELGTQVRPKDPMAWVWLSQIIELQSRKEPEDLRLAAIEKAEANLAKAAEVAKADDIQVAMARFNFYQATNNSDGQQKIFDQIQQSKQIEPALQSVAIAQIHESLGRIDPAIEEYRKAISLGGNDLELRTRIAQLFVKENRLEEAIGCLQEIVDRHPSDTGSRRRLATLLANRSLDEDWTKVAELLSPQEQSKSPEDIRLQVLLLSQRNNLENLQKAQALLERVVELPNVRTDEDHFQLASLYMRSARLLESISGRELEVAQTKEAAGRMLKLATSNASPKIEYIYTYADYLIRQKRFFDAVEESQKLDAIAADSFLAVLLKARITKLEGNSEAAKTSILAWLETKRQLEGANPNSSKIAGYLVQAGQALQILEHPEDSQKLLKEAYKLDKRAGTNYIRSILMTDDASTRTNAVRFLMDRLKNEATSESAVLLSLLVRRGDTDDQLIASAQQQLVEYSVSQKDDRKILQSLADLWVWQGNESQAIETFQRIIQDRPNDVIALNNLAMLMADAPDGSQDALKYINRAIELIGTNPSLMDSKAYVLLRLGKYNESIAILTALINKKDSVVAQFHLYQALMKNDQAAQARELLTKIDIKELRKTPLTNSDQKELQELEKSLASE